MQAWTAGLQATAGPRSSFVFVMPGERLQATHCPGQRDTNCNYQLGLMLHHAPHPGNHYLNLFSVTSPNTAAESIVSTLSKRIYQRFWTDCRYTGPKIFFLSSYKSVLNLRTKQSNDAKVRSEDIPPLVCIGLTLSKMRYYHV